MIDVSFDSHRRLAIGVGDRCLEFNRKRRTIRMRCNTCTSYFSSRPAFLAPRVVSRVSSNRSRWGKDSVRHRYELELLLETMVSKEVLGRQAPISSCSLLFHASLGFSSRPRLIHGPSQLYDSCGEIAIHSRVFDPRFAVTSVRPRGTK